MPGSVELASGNLVHQDRLLVVEDDPSVRRILGIMLRSAGYGVAEAETGPAALAALEAGGVAGVLLDLGLADRRSADIIAWLNAHQESPPWLVLSAMDRTEAARLDNGIGERFVAKPFDPWALLDRIKSMTGHDGGED